MTSCKRSSARSRRGRSGSASRRWPRTASRRGAAPAGEGGGGGAGSAAHDPRQGPAALGGRAGDPGRVEGNRTMAPAVRRDGALEETPWTQAQQEAPAGGPPADLREV